MACSQVSVVGPGLWSRNQPTGSDGKLFLHCCRNPNAAG
jgi:hypothetical protein